MEEILIKITVFVFVTDDIVIVVIYDYLLLLPSVSPLYSSNNSGGSVFYQLE